MAELLVDSDDADVVGMLGLVGMCLVETEQLTQAERFLVTVVRRSRQAGATASGAMSAAILAEKHWRTGDWLEAAHLASSDVADGATMPVNQAWTSAFLAHLDAAAGRAESCRQRAAVAVREGGATGSGVVLIWAGHAMGLLEVGLGRWGEAARQLDRVAVLTESLGRHQPGAVWWQGDHIEALVRAGRPDDAARALDRLERERAVGDQRWPACVAARGRALLAAVTDADGDAGRALADLAESIELAESIPCPFEAARSRLVRGERLLAAGSVEAGTADLRDALGGFDRLGAAAFAERTRALLGEPVAARYSAGLAELLTPGELRVALAVAKGATNREVGSDLFVSVKTVDYHLQNVYRKLNLRSRTELAVRVSQAAPG
jgi:DNA-binding NarL/FixJ family response regulator